MENGHFLGQERWSKLCFCLWFWYGDKRMQEEAFNLCEVCSQHVSYGLLWLPSPSLLCFWAKKNPKTCPASIWNGLGFALLMSLCAGVWAVPRGAVMWALSEWLSVVWMWVSFQTAPSSCCPSIPVCREVGRAAGSCQPGAGGKPCPSMRDA